MLIVDTNTQVSDSALNAMLRESSPNYSELERPAA